jgi:zinc/manganese transport system substrate-binding protein
MGRRLADRAALSAGAALVLAACGTSSGSNSTAGSGGSNGSGGSGSGKVITAAASINAWGSILDQLGGTHVKTTSLISNPDTDPHAYEPTPADGRVIATASLFVENGIGYDSWAAKAVAADPDPSRTVIDVGELTGTPNGGNPHRWYSPSVV